MPGGHVLLVLAGAEHLADQVGVLYGDVEEIALAGGEVMSHGSLIHMSAVI